MDLTFTVPAGVTTSHFYQIYRSGASATAADEANDELQLVIEKNPTSSEISALSVTVTDNVPDALRGATLYTSPSQQGIAASNDAPPLCKDMTTFKGHALYANTETRQRYVVNLIAVGSDDLNYYDDTGDTSSGSPIIQNIGDTTGWATGQLVTGTGIPSDARVLTVDSGTQVTLDANATANGTGVSIRARDRVTIDSEDY